MNGKQTVNNLYFVWFIYESLKIYLSLWKFKNPSQDIPSRNCKFVLF